MTGIKNKFDGFEREPSPDAWKKISGELDKNQAKTRVWFYFAAASLALGIVLGYNYLQHDEPLYNTNKITTGTNPVDVPVEVKSREDEHTKDLRKTDKKNTVDYDKTTVPNNTITQANTDKTDVVKDHSNNTIESNSKNNKTANKAEDEMINSVNVNVPKGENDAANNNEFFNNHIDQNSLDELAAHTAKDNEDQNSEKGNLIDKPVDHESNDAAEGKINFNHDNQPENQSTLLGSKDELVNELAAKVKEEENTLLRSEISFLSVAKTMPISNNSVYNALDNERKLSVKKVAFWSLGARYKQSVVDYSANSSINYAFAEDLTATLNTIPIEYANSKPFWIDLIVTKKITQNLGLNLTAEYGEITGSVFNQENLVYQNKNRNYALGAGMVYDVFKRNKLSINSGVLVFTGYSTNNWKKVGEDQDNTTDNVFTSGTADESFSTDAGDVQNNNIFVNGEFDVTLKYQLNENTSMQVGPFAKRNISKVFPGSDNFSKPFHWGFGMGVLF